MRTKLFILFFIVPVVFSMHFLKAQDSVKTYYLSPIEIVAKKEINLFDSYKYGTNYNSGIFDKNGFSILRRGPNFTQDIYFEGFKRGDIKVLVDGEQYHNACPNRMDAPSTRVNPLEMQSVNLSKSAALLHTGIYGSINYERADIEERFKIKSFLNGNSGSEQDLDFGTSVEGYKTSAVFRYATGRPYKNGEGKKFNQLYGYKDNFKYNFGNIGLRHQSEDFQTGANFAYGENISFPYLMMDEIYSKVFSGFFEFKGSKAYFNYTDHLMNNSLRTSSVFMETAAKNFTFGLTSSFYEIVYRQWNADNVIKNPMMNVSISNKLMPDVKQFSAIVSESFQLGDVNIAAKGGGQYLFIGDESRLNFYKTLYPNAKENRFFISAGLNVNYSIQLTRDLILFVSAEGASDAPDPEHLYIAVQRPMTNPNISGNPTLNQPIKTGLRTSINYDFLSLEGYVNYIVNYIDVVKRSAAKNYLTYDNIKALLMGLNLSAQLNFFETYLSYIYGENVTNSTPLAEISPLSITSKITLPEVYNLNFYITHTYQNTQKRIDINLMETPSAAWNTIGIGADYQYSNLRFLLEVDNLLNHNYSRHLSYARNPFASGMKIYEPGRTFRLTVYFDKLFN